MHLRYGSNQISVDRRSVDEIANLPIPALGSNDIEPLPLADAEYSRTESFDIWQDRLFKFGIAYTRIEDPNLSQSAGELYNELFRLTRGSHLYRIWNYIPRLNSGDGDNERYRQFSLGRSQSFRQEFGKEDTSRMPAGTCVGIEGEHMAICFLAGNPAPDHHENPNQVPAYRYPRQYGPKSPSFARATSVSVESRHYQFISGTAAVVGHQSVGLDDLEEQIEVTCNNIYKVASQTGNLNGFVKEDQSLYSCKVYLRRSTDLPLARKFLRQRFPEDEQRFVYLQSEICRRELLVEIELSYRNEVRLPHLL